MSKRLIMTFEVEIENVELLCSEQDLKECYESSWHKFCDEMFREEGFWWGEEIKFKGVRMENRP